jgi:hypothetical protein
MHGREWTAEEDDILMRCYPHEDTRVVLEKLNRGINSVKHRARKLGIRKTKEAYDKARANTYKKEGHEINKLPPKEVPLGKAYMNEKWLYQKYVSEEFSSLDIAEITGVEKTTVLRWLKTYEIERRDNEDITDRTRLKISEHASKRRGPQVGRWNGGVSEYGHNGYRFILDPDHPNALDGYVAEHRLVMEFMLGRLLTSDDIVHHRDENKKNNVSSNLFLFPDRSSHAKFHQYKRYKDPNISEEDFMATLSRIRAT